MSLAAIQKIDAIRSIDNADRLELAIVKGWQVVVKKGEYKAGDICIYIEIDSLLPDTAHFSFLKRNPNKMYRLKTVKLRGQISQGLIIPVPIELNNVGIGTEVTNILGIEKYVAPELKGYNQKSIFPPYVPKTDQPRIQSHVEIFPHLKNVRFCVSEKIDGTSATYVYNQGDKEICSRNFTLKDDTKSHYHIINETYDILNKLEKYCADYNRNIAIQGEIAGPKIQRNCMKLARYKFFAFDIYDIDAQKYFDYELFKSACYKMGIPTVYTSHECFYLPEKKTEDILQYLLELAKGEYDSGVTREGIVVKTWKESFCGPIGRTSFKVINNDFLLRE